MNKKINNLILSYDDSNATILEEMLKDDYMNTINGIFANYKELIKRGIDLEVRVAKKRNDLKLLEIDSDTLEQNNNIDKNTKRLLVPIKKMDNDIKKIYSDLETYNHLLASLLDINLDKTSKKCLFKRLARCLNIDTDSDIQNFINESINDIIGNAENNDLSQLLILLILEIRNLDIINMTLKSYNTNNNKIIGFKDSYQKVMERIIDCLLECNDIKEQDYYFKVIELMIKWDKDGILKENKLFYTIKLKPLEHDHRVVTLMRKLNENNLTFDDIAKRHGLFLEHSEYIKEDIPVDKKRHNFMYQDMVTIDKSNSQCLDDGFYLELNRNGTYTLYIHIIDVASYVKYGGDIFYTAIQRGESFYFSKDTYPMLPDKLAYDICSFYTPRVHNAITLIVKFDSDFNMLPNSVSIVPSRVLTRYQLNYDTVDYQLDHGSSDYKHDIMMEYLALITLKLANSNANKKIYRTIENIVKERSYHESINTDISVSANIVHELMILYNEKVAEYMKKRSLPYIYRNNVFDPFSKYEREKLLIDGFINEQNIDKELLLLHCTKDCYFESSYSDIALRHEGLNLSCYSHSCSPARRAVDMLLQYVIHDLVFSHNISGNDIDKWCEIVRDMSEYFNKRSKLNDQFVKEYEYLNQKKLIKR